MATGWFQAGFQLELDADDDAFLVFCGASSSWGACRVLLGKGGSPYRDLLKEEGRFRAPS